MLESIKTLLFNLTEKPLIFSNSFSEFSDHFILGYQNFCDSRNHALTQSSAIANNARDLSQAHSFEVIQWNKDDIATYWLGNDVGCCLATDGGQFQALVQRRMDDAMFFHVVIDLISRKPVALSWLYFATDSLEPGKIYVIANFVEMAAKYVLDEKMQQEILCALFTYTEQFCKDIGATAFLVNHLTYGWMPDFTNFEQKHIQPIKVEEV